MSHWTRSHSRDDHMHRLKQNLQHSSSICYHNKMFLMSGSILHLGSLCATMHACSKVPSLSSYIGNLCPHCCTSTSRKNATRVHLALVFQSIRSVPSKFISFFKAKISVSFKKATSTYDIRNARQSISDCCYY